MINDTPEKPESAHEIGDGEPPLVIPESGIVAYNLREGERPAGLKVRYKIRIETGPKARELDEAQADVIRELLEWARQYRAQTAERQANERGT